MYKYARKLLINSSFLIVRSDYKKVTWEQSDSNVQDDIENFGFFVRKRAGFTLDQTETDSEAEDYDREACAILSSRE